ncbi:MAG: hypothetical protein ACRD6W_04870 [Nitrososphaerales archaeon]
MCSPKGAPGVTTLACAIGAVWPQGRNVLLAECDPSGGDLAARFSLSSKCGMTSFVMARRHSPAATSDDSNHVQQLPGGLEAVVGPIGSGPANALDHEIAALEWPFFSQDVDVVFDCGRFVPTASGQRSILERSDSVLVVTNPEPSGLAHSNWLLERLRTVRAQGCPQVVLAGEGSVPSREVSDVLGVRVLHLVPADPRAAAVFCGVPGRASNLARSSLVLAGRRLVQAVIDLPLSGDVPQLATDQSSPCDQSEKRLEPEDCSK